MFLQKMSLGRVRNYIVSKIFIDTNILVYTLDTKNKEKRDAAREIVKKVVESHLPVISTQVIQEFYVVASSKLKADSIVVKNIIHNFHNMEIVNNDLELIEQAIDISVLSQLSFWDSLIIASAEKANCEYVLSEYLNSGQNYRGIKLLNPFLQDF